MRPVDVLLVIYAISFVVSLVFQVVEVWIDIKEDVRRRDRVVRLIQPSGYYNPVVTVGSLLVRTLASVVPVINTFTAIFLLCEYFPRALKRFGRLFEIPLIKLPKNGESNV